MLQPHVVAGERLTTTRINEAEVRVGIHRSRDVAVARAAVSKVMGRLEVLDFDSRSAERFALMKARLLDIGRPAGDMDVLIAAIAVINDQVLITRNPRHFADIPGVRVESY